MASLVILKYVFNIIVNIDPDLELLLTLYKGFPKPEKIVINRLPKCTHHKIKISILQAV